MWADCRRHDGVQRARPEPNAGNNVDTLSARAARGGPREVPCLRLRALLIRGSRVTVTRIQALPKARPRNGPRSNRCDREPTARSARGRCRPESRATCRSAGATDFGRGHARAAARSREAPSTRSGSDGPWSRTPLMYSTPAGLMRSCPRGSDGSGLVELVLSSPWVASRGRCVGRDRRRDRVAAPEHGRERRPRGRGGGHEVPSALLTISWASPTRASRCAWPRKLSA